MCRSRALPVAALAVFLFPAASLAQPGALPIPPLVSQKKPPAARPVEKPSPELVKVQKLFAAAAEKQRAGRVGEAISLYRQMLEVATRAKVAETNLFPVYANLGLLYQQQGNAKSAEAFYRKAMAANPKNPGVVLALAQLLLAEHHIPEAQAAAERGLKLNPKSAQAHFVLGGCAALKGQMTLAEREYREAVRLEPRNPQSLFNLGFAQARQKRYPEAIKSFRGVLQIDARNAQARNYLVTLYQAQKDYKSALAEAKRAVADHPDDAIAQFNLGLCYQLQAEAAKDRKLNEEAISAYVEAIRLNPRYLPARVNVARLYFQLGNYRQAASHFAAAAALDPRNARLMGDTALSEGWAATGATSQDQREALRLAAEQHYRRAIEIEPLPVLYGGLAGLYQQQNNTAKALEVLQEWTQKQPKDADAWTGLAQAQMAANKTDDAVKSLQQAIAVKPKAADARLNLGALYERVGKTDLAAEQYKTVETESPREKQAYLRLGQLYRTQKKSKEAIAQFEEMKKVDPKDRASYVALATLYEEQKDPDAALKEYTQLRDALPDDYTAHWYLAQSLERAKRYGEAIAEYRAMERLQPTDSPAALNIPRLYELDGKTDLAMAEYRRLREKDPRNVMFALAYGDALQKARQWDDARKQYEAILDVAASSPQARQAALQIGEGYVSSGKPAEAETWFRKAAEAPGVVGRAGAYSRLERYYQEQKAPGKALDFLEGALRKDPTDEAALIRYEDATQTQGQVERKWAFLKQLAGGGAKANAAYLRAYAACLQRASKGAEAVEVYRQIAALDPNDYGTRASLAEMLDAQKKRDEAIAVYEQVIRIPTLGANEKVGYRLRLAGLYEAVGRKADALALYQAVKKDDPNNTVAQAGLKRLGG